MVVLLCDVPFPEFRTSVPRWSRRFCDSSGRLLLPFPPHRSVPFAFFSVIRRDVRLVFLPPLCLPICPDFFLPPFFARRKPLVSVFFLWGGLVFFFLVSLEDATPPPSFD